MKKQTFIGLMIASFSICFGVSFFLPKKTHATGETLQTKCAGDKPPRCFVCKGVDECQSACTGDFQCRFTTDNDGEVCYNAVDICKPLR